MARETTGSRAGPRWAARLSGEGLTVGPRISRRQAIGAGLAGLGSVAVAACSSGGSRATAAGPSGTVAPTTIDLPAEASQLGAGAFQLFAQDDLNFQALFALGGAGLNSEVGEVITAVDQANAATGGATYQSFFDAFVATGNQLNDLATQALHDHHVVTARSQFLRSAQYYNQALFFVLGTETPDAEERVYTTMDAAFRQAARLMDPGWEPVAIPYENTTLPGFFLKAVGASGRRPTVIVNNGSDAQMVDLWAYGGQAAIERGYNALIFEGPGQGANLFVKKMPFRHDWEKVITPVVDFLVKRPDVDPHKIGITGWSFGGALVARAAAYEKRLAAVVSDPGFVTPYASYPAFLKQVAEAGDQQKVNTEWANTVVPGSTPEQHFLLQKRLEIYTTDALDQARKGEIPSDWYTISRAIQGYDVTPFVKRITAPYLVIGYQGDTFFPGAPQQFFDLLPGRDKTITTLTVAEGAQYHCAPMAPERRNEVVFDWMDDTFSR
jgi:hypothetical protein